MFCFYDNTKDGLCIGASTQNGVKQMDELGRIQCLLAEKQQRMLLFEQATEEMLVCPFERLQPLVLQREEEMQQMQALDTKIKGLCIGKDGALVLAAAENRCSRNALPVQLVAIYDAGMQVKTVAARLKESNVQAVFRLRTEQKQIVKKIKTTNQSPAAQASRFSSPTRQREPGQLGKG